MTTAFYPTNPNERNHFCFQPLYDLQQKPVLNKQKNDVLILDTLSKKVKVRKQMKKQAELNELREKYKNNEISKAEYYNEAFPKKLISFLTSSQDERKEASKKLKLQELKEKYNNGEISKAKYFAQKLGVILFYSPKPQTNTKYLALGTTTA